MHKHACAHTKHTHISLSLWQVILMDHVDWLDLDTANTVAKTLAEQVLPGGIVIWRSAAMEPPYAALIAKAGFDVKCVQRADQGYMDRVNMYSSFYVAKRKAKRE
jgi:betaine lipid synthase